MTIRFGNNRLGFYVVVFLLSGTVLGLTANFAALFLPNIHRDFIRFSLIVSSLTIFTFLLTLQWAQPYTEAIVLFILGVLWLAMGAWATDIIGYVQCDALGGQKTPSKSGEINAQAYCYEMKVIQAFSWALFILFVIAFYILHQLVALAQHFGRLHIWSEPIRELPWFGEMPGYYNTHGQAQMPFPHSAGPMTPGYGYPYPTTMPMTTVIQPGMNGAPPTVTQVPLSA